MVSASVLITVFVSFHLFLFLINFWLSFHFLLNFSKTWLLILLIFLYCLHFKLIISNLNFCQFYSYGEPDSYTWVDQIEQCSEIWADPVLELQAFESQVCRLAQCRLCFLTLKQEWDCWWFKAPEKFRFSSSSSTCWQRLLFGFWNCVACSQIQPQFSKCLNLLFCRTLFTLWAAQGILGLVYPPPPCFSASKVFLYWLLGTTSH